MKHKPLDRQTIVVTGASSGIGLTTVRMAVARGARVVLAARSADVLAQLAAALGSTTSPTWADGGTSRLSPTRPSRRSAASTPGSTSPA